MITAEDIKRMAERGESYNVDDEQLLENLQAFTENGDVKRGAILFFDEHPENLFFHAVVRCTQFKGTNKLHIIDDKTFGGPLVAQYEQALSWLQDKLKLEYEIKGTGARTEKWEMPLDVFREALINCVLCKCLHKMAYVKSFVM